MVLQVVDLLYIKYESQEFIVMYISNHWMETTREGMSILLEESEGCSICTLQKQTPKRYMMAPESSNRKSDHEIYSKGSKGRSSKKNKK